MLNFSNLLRQIRGTLVVGMLLCAFTLTGCQSSQLQTMRSLNKAQIAVLKQEGFTETAGAWTFGLWDKLLFRTDEDKLTPESRRTIERIGRSLLAVGRVHLRVLGYTDSSGKDLYNNSLSERRAAAVVDALVGAGMTPGNIQRRGLGSRNPISDNLTAEGRAQNRRVAIIVVAE